MSCDHCLIYDQCFILYIFDLYQRYLNSTVLRFCSQRWQCWWACCILYETSAICNFYRWIKTTPVHCHLLAPCNLILPVQDLAQPSPQIATHNCSHICGWGWGNVSPLSLLTLIVSLIEWRIQETVTIFPVFKLSQGGSTKRGWSPQMLVALLSKLRWKRKKTNVPLLPGSHDLRCPAPAHHPSHKRVKTKVNSPSIKLFLFCIWSQWLYWLLLYSWDQNIEGSWTMVSEVSVHHRVHEKERFTSLWARIQKEVIKEESKTSIWTPPHTHIVAYFLQISSTPPSPNKTIMLWIHQGINPYITLSPHNLIASENIITDTDRGTLH